MSHLPSNIPVRLCAHIEVYTDCCNDSKSVENNYVVRNRKTRQRKEGSSKSDGRIYPSVDLPKKPISRLFDDVSDFHFMVGAGLRPPEVSI